MERPEVKSADIARTWRQYLPRLLSIFVLALVVRSLTAYFVGTHLDDAGWFPYGIYNIFDAQAKAVLNGSASAFWITDPSQTSVAIYPPGYSLWLAFLYGLGGMSTASGVQVVQTVLDSISVLIIVAIGANAFEWRVGLAAGTLAALSPLLAFYGASPLADAPTSWLVLAGVWMAVRAAKNSNFPWAIGAGLMIGASCWFRANAFLLTFILAAALPFYIRETRRKQMLVAAGMILGALIVTAPIVIRNSIAFQAFVPTGLGAGTNLWEGIGETERAAEFGAVYGDSQLLEKERVEQNLPQDDRVNLYWPDGVQRDRERMRKALHVVAADPVWYAGVMARRMSGLLKYAGEDSAIYGTTGINITAGKCLPPSLRFFPFTLIVTALGYAQSVLRYIILPLIIFGFWLAGRRDRRITILLAATIFYYLVFGASLHSEIRYSLPMQAILLVFAGVAVVSIVENISIHTGIPAKK
jgi:Dolichyl-phosphate-mannose-protein mannosyltransferase